MTHKPNSKFSSMSNLNFEPLLFLSLLLVGNMWSVENLFANTNIRSELMKTKWNAFWIEVPESSATDYGVYLFRKTINLDKIPESLPVLVSADNRCKLYVNGELVLVGPPRGDAKNWNFVEVDLAPELRIGKKRYCRKSME